MATCGGELRKPLHEHCGVLLFQFSTPGVARVRDNAAQTLVRLGRVRETVVPASLAETFAFFADPSRRQTAEPWW